MTTRAVVIGGVEVPDGARLMLALGAANHDPREFPEPAGQDFRYPANISFRGPERLLAEWEAG